MQPDVSGNSIVALDGDNNSLLLSGTGCLYPQSRYAYAESGQNQRVRGC